MNFNDFSAECYRSAKKKGFYDSAPTATQFYASRRFLEIICEAAKDFESERKSTKTDPYTIQDKEARSVVKTALLASEIAEVAEWCLKFDLEDNTTVVNGERIGKPEGYASELADVLIRLGDQCGCDEIDMEYELERKLAYNATRAYRNGKSF